MNRLLTILRHSLLRMRWQILGWGLGIGALGLILVPFYDIFMSRQGDFMKMLEGYPPEFLAFFGGDTTSLLTPEGYLGMYGFSMLPVIIGIFAVLTGSGLIASDEEKGRLDLILSHPVGRTAFFLGRVLAFTMALIVILIIAWLGFCVLLPGSSMQISWGKMAVPFIPLFAQAFIYGSLALLLSMMLPSRNTSAACASVVMLGSYFLSSMAFINDSLNRIARLLPYAYYQGTGAIEKLNTDWLFWLIFASVVMILLAWWRFSKRNIHLSGEGSISFQFLKRVHRKHASTT